MVQNKKDYIGFTCAYTPLPLIDAAGFVPYRILPLTDSPERAGQILNENLCPHVKRVLDRALDEDLPERSGMVFMSSCDAMRRLADAWAAVRPADQAIQIDLPATTGHSSITFLSRELSRLADTLERWSGKPLTASAIKESVSIYNFAAQLFETLRNKHYSGALSGGTAALQDLYNQASISPIRDVIKKLESLAALPEIRKQTSGEIPIYFFWKRVSCSRFPVAIRIVGNQNSWRGPVYWVQGVPTLQFKR